MAKRYLTLDDITAEAMSIIPGATSEEKLYARTWAYRALRQFGPSQNNIEVCDLYPDSFAFTKPDDFISAIDIALYDEADRELKSKYKNGKTRIFQKREPLDDRIEISEDDFFFYISTDAADVAKAKLRYYAHPLDKDGNPQFPEYLVIPISLFIRYFWALRNNESAAQSHEQSWKMAKSEVMGKHRPVSGLRFKQLTKEWNSMINKYNHDSF